ncbi:hypothetical protein Tco_0893812 [Tanacetum coccineum]|uniref:Uncharacterized protein n=1 Tax=Tanacetum coccineum TaxID=301880 RepID=A0ABQ5C9X3_9ASTR
MVKGICLQPQLEKDFCWNFTKLQPVQLTIIMTMSSKVPEMSKKRSMEKECRFRASGAGNDPPAKCDMFRVVRKELQGQVSASKGTSRMMELRWESYVIIGMEDRLAYHRALINCYEKICVFLFPNARFLKYMRRRPNRILRSPFMYQG